MITKREKLNKYTKQLRQIFQGRKGKAYPAFIFGEQRSGTNMLLNTLNRSNEVLCYNETDDDAFKNCVLKEHKTISKLANKSYGKVVIFKSIADSQNALRIFEEQDSAKAIWIFRNYFDVVNSNLRAFKEHYKYLYYILYEPENASWRAENITEENMELIRHFYERKISDASSRALIWYLRNCQFYQQRLFEKNNVILVNYENLVKFPQESFRFVFDFLNVEFRDSYINRVFKSSVSKNVKPEIADEIEGLCSSLYEKMSSMANV